MVLSYPLDNPRANAFYHGYAHWPAPVMAAMRARMVLEGMQARRYVYVPAAGPPAAAGVCPPQ